MITTPKLSGFKMPAEWSEHSATWLAWPYDKITFPDRVEKVEKIYIEIISALVTSEQVNLIVRDESVKDKVLKLLNNNDSKDKINFFITDYADVWLRDYGPTFLKNNQGDKAWLKWGYNAYSNKFPDLLKDDKVFDNITTQVNSEKISTDLIMEGGSIESNGQGIILTTEECLLNPGRNPKLSKSEIEEKLKDYLGAEKIIWLKKGIVNDHTDGHIDILARFVNENTILLAWTDNESNPNYNIVRENLDILNNETTLSGDKFNVVRLPLPNVNYDNGELAPASYANFYIANKVILAVKFNQPTDNLANEIISQYFLDRKIINIDCNDLLYGGGELHCITQQEPI